MDTFNGAFVNFYPYLYRYLKYNKNMIIYIFRLSLFHILSLVFLQATGKTINNYSLATLGNIAHYLRTETIKNKNSTIINIQQK